MSCLSYHNKTKNKRKQRKPKSTTAQLHTSVDSRIKILLSDRLSASLVRWSHNREGCAHCHKHPSTSNLFKTTAPNALFGPQRTPRSWASLEGSLPPLCQSLLAPPCLHPFNGLQPVLAASLPQPHPALNPARTEACFLPSPLPNLPTPDTEQFIMLHTLSFHQYEANSGRRKVHDSYNLEFVVKFSLSWAKERVCCENSLCKQDLRGKYSSKERKSFLKDLVQ